MEPTIAHLRAAAMRAPFTAPHCTFCHAPRDPLGGGRPSHTDSCPETTTLARRELAALERGEETGT